ncbi:MAG TPA: hypothetical protein VGN90_01485 [Pyrinomonadaceae bacterium]|jgi:hypothetical protein|nr:hypothetical protein [Pyrinomonadaceae bacterium]
MADRYDSNHLGAIVDFVANPPIANADTPQVFCHFYFETTVRTWIIRESKGSGYDAIPDRPVEPF